MSGSKNSLASTKMFCVVASEPKPLGGLLTLETCVQVGCGLGLSHSSEKPHIFTWRSSQCTREFHLK